MAEITYRGVTYTDDRLTFRFDKVKGEYKASLDGYFHAVGWPKDLAVRRLNDFLKREYPDVWRGAEDRLADFFNADKGGKSWLITTQIMCSLKLMR